MEPEGSLLSVQVSAICLYPEPDQSSPCPPIPLLEDPSSYHHPIYARFFQVVSFPHFPHQNPACTSPVHTTCPAHLILLHLMTRIIFGKEYRSLSSSWYSFLHSPVISSLLGPNILLSTLFSNTLSLRSSLSVRDNVSHPYKTNRQNYCSVYLNFYILDSNW